jgi:hypothetical protein
MYDCRDISGLVQSTSLINESLPCKLLQLLVIALLGIDNRITCNFTTYPEILLMLACLDGCSAPCGSRQYDGLECKSVCGLPGLSEIGAAGM